MASSKARAVARAAQKKLKHNVKNVAQQTVKEGTESITQKATKNVVKGASNVFEDFHMRNNGTKNVFEQVQKQTTRQASQATTRNVDDFTSSLFKTNMPKASSTSGVDGFTDRLNYRAHHTLDVNQIQTNKGEGFFKTIMKGASDLLEGPMGQTFDKHTGLHSFAKGLTKKGGAKYEGGRVSKAMQNAGYIKKNAAGEITDIDYGKIAKGYMAAGVGARIVTGGGLYKDGQGNSNIAGVPFI